MFSYATGRDRGAGRAPPRHDRPLPGEPPRTPRSRRCRRPRRDRRLYGLRRQCRGGHRVLDAVRRRRRRRDGGDGRRDQRRRRVRPPDQPPAGPLGRTLRPALHLDGRREPAGRRGDALPDDAGVSGQHRPRYRRYRDRPLPRRRRPGRGRRRRTARRPPRYAPVRALLQPRDLRGGRAGSRRAAEHARALRRGRKHHRREHRLLGLRLPRGPVRRRDDADAVTRTRWPTHHRRLRARLRHRERTGRRPGDARLGPRTRVGPHRSRHRLERLEPGRGRDED